jgi:hypothetical protein
MATVAFFIVTIVIIAECQSQDNNDYVSTKETIIEPTEVVETSMAFYITNAFYTNNPDFF